MDFEDIARFQLKRVNPFQGLVIDSETWRDAHEYHRSQQRLHMLAFHNVGIAGGLKVIANEPADLSVSIQLGMAVDNEGNVIINVKGISFKDDNTMKGKHIDVIIISIRSKYLSLISCILFSLLLF